MRRMRHSRRKLWSDHDAHSIGRKVDLDGHNTCPTPGDVKFYMDGLTTSSPCAKCRERDQLPKITGYTTCSNIGPGTGPKPHFCSYDSSVSMTHACFSTRVMT